MRRFITAGAAVPFNEHQTLSPYAAWRPTSGSCLPQADVCLQAARPIESVAETRFTRRVLLDMPSASDSTHRGHGAHRAED